MLQRREICQIFRRQGLCFFFPCIPGAGEAIALTQNTNSSNDMDLTLRDTYTYFICHPTIQIGHIQFDPNGDVDDDHAEIRTSSSQLQAAIGAECGDVFETCWIASQVSEVANSSPFWLVGTQQQSQTSTARLPPPQPPPTQHRPTALHSQHDRPVTTVTRARRQPGPAAATGLSAPAGPGRRPGPGQADE
jgi:hypothetical protein